jgi:hypothetical protein
MPAVRGAGLPGVWSPPRRVRSREARSLHESGGSRLYRSGPGERYHLQEPPTQPQLAPCVGQPSTGCSHVVATLSAAQTSLLQPVVRH